MTKYVLLTALCVFTIALSGRAAIAQAMLDPRPNCAEVKKSLNALQIRALITEMSAIEGKGDYYRFSQVYPVLAQLNKVVASAKDIETFRCEDDLSVIRKLVAFSRTQERGVRINASLLLAKVVDNTTLCGVLEELFDRSVEDDTRFNLWQIVLVVASSARRENREWTRATIKNNMEFMAKDPNFGKTRRIINEVGLALAKNGRSDLLQATYPDEYQACITLPNISALVKPSP